MLCDNEEALKALKEALECLSRISAILNTIMNNSINQGLRICHWIPAQSHSKTLKLDTRTVSCRVDLVLFDWLWRVFRIAITYTDETYMWNNWFLMRQLFQHARAFTYNRNQFFESYIIYLYVNIITKRENDHFNSSKIIL